MISWLKLPKFGIFLNARALKLIRKFAIPELFVFIVFFANCTAPAVKLKCEEIRARVDHQDPNPDQRRFAEEELRACEEELDSAKTQDSTALEKLHQRFSPQDNL
jgi:hypothetical protein